MHRLLIHSFSFLPCTTRVDDSEPHQLLHSWTGHLDFRSRWIVFIHVVQDHPRGLLQFSKGELFLAVSSGIRAIWQNMKKHYAWTTA